MRAACCGNAFNGYGLRSDGPPDEDRRFQENPTKVENLAPHAGKSRTSALRTPSHHDGVPQSKYTWPS